MQATLSVMFLLTSSDVTCTSGSWADAAVSVAVLSIVFVKVHLHLVQPGQVVTCLTESKIRYN